MVPRAEAPSTTALRVFSHVTTDLTASVPHGALIVHAANLHHVLSMMALITSRVPHRVQRSGHTALHKAADCGAFSRHLEDVSPRVLANCRVEGGCWGVGGFINRWLSHFTRSPGWSASAVIPAAAK